MRNNYKDRDLHMGFGLPKPKKTVRFTRDQHKYLTDLFNAGITIKNNRARPSPEAHDMLFLFESELCLTESKILAYFSRLSEKRKKDVTNEVKTNKKLNLASKSSSSRSLQKSQKEKTLLATLSE